MQTEFFIFYTYKFKSSFFITRMHHYFTYFIGGKNEAIYSFTYVYKTRYF